MGVYAPTPNDVEIVRTLVGIGLTGFALISGYLIHLNRKDLPKTKQKQTHRQAGHQKLDTYKRLKHSLIKRYTREGHHTEEEFQQFIAGMQKISELRENTTKAK